mmetsp:Transcript_7619/g.31529  ORF Transcript_7619/g.31529 Transcript_7619/m.31529 type:complete len:506 (+) Transcript_7619:32-1549(+)
MADLAARLAEVEAVAARLERLVAAQRDELTWQRAELAKVEARGAAKAAASPSVVDEVDGDVAHESIRRLKASDASATRGFRHSGSLGFRTAFEAKRRRSFARTESEHAVHHTLERVEESIDCPSIYIVKAASRTRGAALTINALCFVVAFVQVLFPVWFLCNYISRSKPTLVAPGFHHRNHTHKTKRRKWASYIIARRLSHSLAATLQGAHDTAKISPQAQLRNRAELVDLFAIYSLVGVEPALAQHAQVFHALASTPLQLAPVRVREPAHHGVLRRAHDLHAGAPRAAAARPPAQRRRAGLHRHLRHAPRQDLRGPAAAAAAADRDEGDARRRRRQARPRRHAVRDPQAQGAADRGAAVGAARRDDLLSPPRGRAAPHEGAVQFLRLRPVHPRRHRRPHRALAHRQRPLVPVPRPRQVQARVAALPAQSHPRARPVQARPRLLPACGAHLGVRLPLVSPRSRPRPAPQQTGRGPPVRCDDAPYLGRQAQVDRQPTPRSRRTECE